MPFIQSLVGFKCSIPLIPFVHPDVVIAISQINLGEDLGTMELIQHVIKPWDGMLVLDYVDCSTIHTQNKGSCFL